MRTEEKSIACVLKDKIFVANNVMTLRLEALKGETFAFKAGQYVLVGVGGSGSSYTTEKMYTISSAPDLFKFNITVRKIGVFSSILHGLSVGSGVTIKGPYGDLCPGKDSDRVAFIAGGIGITPFYSMIQQYVREKNDRPKQVTLIYSNRTRSDSAFLKELDGFTAKWSGLKIINTFTRENVDKVIGEKGRISESLIKKYINDFLEREYFICGSIDFSDSMWRMLNKIGIPEERIFIETFY